MRVPDPCLPAGLTQRDIDRACFGDDTSAEKAEREMERGDRMRQEAIDRELEDRYEQPKTTTEP